MPKNIIYIYIYVCYINIWSDIWEPCHSLRSAKHCRFWWFLVQVPGTLDDFRRQTSQGMARELRLLPRFPGSQQHQAGGRPAKVVPLQQPGHPSDQGEDQPRASGQQRGHCIQVLLGQVMEHCWGMITDLLPIQWGWSGLKMIEMEINRAGMVVFNENSGMQ